SNNNLTLTPNGSGNIVLTSDSDSGVFIGSSANTPAPLSISGGIGSNGAFIINQTNSGDIIDASASGITKFVVANNGDLKFAGNTANLSTLTKLETTAQIYSFPDATGTVCLQGAASCGFAIGTNYWQVNNAALAPFNNTVDVLFGGTATSSAKFAFTNVAGGVPTASLSAGGNNNTFLTAAGNLGTTNAQTLTLGGVSTGNIVIDSGSSLISLVDATTLSGNFTQTGVTSFTTGTGLTTVG